MKDRFHRLLFSWARRLTALCLGLYEEPVREEVPAPSRQRRKAALRLADHIPSFVRMKAPYVLGGVPSWLVEYAYEEEIRDLPPIDILFGEQLLFFCFDSPAESGRTVLENLFARRLNLGKDPLPLLPVFLDPSEILAARRPADLTLILNRAYQETLSWALSQLPRIPDLSTVVREETEIGTWIKRRQWVEEARKTAVFPLAVLFDSV